MTRTEFDNTHIVDRLRRLPTWNLSQAAGRGHALLRDRLAAVGATGYEYRVLSALAELGELSQADTGRATGLDRSDVAVTVARLSSQAAVARTGHPEDRRRNIVSMTDLGRLRLKELDIVITQVQDDLLTGIPASERRRLLRLLRHMAAPVA